MAGSGRKFYFTTLRDCLIFFYWLNTDKKNMHADIAAELHNRISKYYNNADKHKIQTALSTFVSNVNKFYTKLVKQEIPKQALVKAASIKSDANATEIADAFLECLPKFLAAMYYLWYNVDAAFNKLGGGAWQDNHPGVDGWRYVWAWGRSGDWGGQTQRYLRATTKDAEFGNNKGVIPGGFEKNDLKEGWDYNSDKGYYYAKSMIRDIEAILRKNEHNYFRDVFVTSVIADKLGAEAVNVANALALVGRFCEIVGEEADKESGGTLKKKLDEILEGENSKKCICWKDLRDHCSKLGSQLGKIFKVNAFSFTGYGREYKDLMPNEFAKDTANWLRNHLLGVKGRMERIEEVGGSLSASQNKNLAEYLTKNFFPYGFTFYSSRYYNNNVPYEVLKTDWDSVIDMLREDDEASGGLKKLVKLLEGETCPPKKPEVPPAKASELPKQPSTEKKSSPPTKTEATKPDPAEPTSTTTATPTPGRNTNVTPNQGTAANGPQNQGKKAEGAQNQGKKAEGAQNQGKKSEGAQNQGKKAEGGPDDGQSEPTSSNSSAAEAVQTHTSSDSRGGSESPGDPGPSSGLGKSGQGSTSDAVQSGGEVAETGTSGSATMSTGSNAGSVGDRDGRDGMLSTPRITCDNGKFITIGSLKLCVSNADLQRQDEVDEKWRKQEKEYDEKMERIRLEKEAAHLKLELEQRKKQEAENESKKHKDIAAKHPLVPAHGYNYHPQNRRYLFPADTYPSPYPYAYTEGPSLAGSAMPPVPANTWLDGRDLDYVRGDVVDHNDEPIEVVAGGKPVLDNSSVTQRQDDIAEIEDVYRKIHEKQKAEGIALKQALEAGPKQQQQDALWTETMDDVLRREKETEDLRQNLQHDTLGEVVNIPFHTKICAPQTIIKREIDGFNTYPPPVIDVRTVDSNRIYSIPDESNTSTKVSHSNEYSDIDIIKAYIPRSPNIETPRIIQDTYNKTALPVSFDDVPTAPTDQDYDGKGMHSENEIKTVYVGVNPAYDIIDDKLQITKVTHTERKETVDLHIDIPDRAVPDSIHDIDFDHEPPLPPKLQPVDPIVPSTPAVNLNIDPFEVAPHSTPTDFDQKTIKQPELKMCISSWATSKPTPGSTDIPETELFPAEAPRTVRDMLTWLAGLKHEKHHKTLEKCISKAFGGLQDDPSQLALSINHTNIRPKDVFDILQLTAMFATSVLTAIAPNWRATVSSRTVKPKSSTKSQEPDCCALLCQLRDYVYACCHQLQFLKSQCSRNESRGGWKNCEYGSEAKMPSPLQAFLTDAHNSKFKTHPFDPCNLCHKSRVRMGFRGKDLPETSQQGSIISSILTPSCGGSDPLLTLCSYLNCLTRRTPRTTGELVSYFHHFGIELHEFTSKSLSPLGNSLLNPHADRPDWDHLGNTDLQAVRGIRGTEPVISKHNSNHDNAHPRTLSTLVGCSDDSFNCHPHCSPITYRAYAMYSQQFAHTYLSWTVYLPDRLHESLEKLYYDLLKHCGSGKCTSLYSCSTALPLLYLHGFTPPEVGSQPKLTCSDVIAKLHEIVNGGSIASLMTAMDNFLYGIREPFIYTVVALWSLAFLIFANTMLYRIDVLHIRSHLIRTKASHLIDVEALLTDGEKMMSLYDANYFDDDLAELLNLI